MNENTGTGVSSEKEKVKESQSRSVTFSLDTPSGAWLGRHKFLNMNRVCFVEFLKIIPVFAPKKKGVINKHFKILKCIISSYLGYCILEVVGRVLEDFEKKNCVGENLEWLLPISSTRSRPSFEVVTCRAPSAQGRGAERAT